jgi:Endonuclease NucS C-terminal domain
MKSPSFKVADAFSFASAHGLQAETAQIQSMAVHPTFKAPNVVRKGYLVELFEARGLMEAFVEQYWSGRHTDAGERRRGKFLDLKLRNEHRLDGELDDEMPEDEDESAEEQRFALEADLRDFLAANLRVIEPGLKLYRDDERDGVEFSVDGGRIDILAIDQNGTPVVIELKLSKGRNRAIGQLLYYMGGVDKNLGKGRSRGIIVARDIPDDLLLATQRVSGVSLCRYSVSMVVEAVRFPGEA